MQKKFISRNPDCSRLVLIYAGWAMDWHPFRNLQLPGYDIMVIWDYRDLTFNWKPLRHYHEVCLVAWSMGVFAASVTIHEILPKVTKRIAINGTLDPIHDTKGIPQAVYHGTINGLAPGTLRKFYRRMCMDANQFASFSENMPKRTIADLSEELCQIETNSIFHVEQVKEWDVAIVSRHDTIFPTQNQVNAWRQIAPVQFMEASHLPDFNRLLPRLVVDKDLVKQRFANAASTYGKNAKAQQRIAKGLFNRFMRVATPQAMNGNILEVGCGDGTLTNLYKHLTHQLATVRLWDLAQVSAKDISGTCFEQCDAETAIRKLPTASQAVIFSASTIQWLNSPATFFRECSRVLIDGGYLVVSSFVRGNLREVSELTGYGMQLPTSEGWRRILPPDMDIFVCEVSPETLVFNSPRDVLEHLRNTGVNAISFGNNTITVTRKLLSQYPHRDDGSCALTYMPIYFVLRKTES